MPLNKYSPFAPDVSKRLGVTTTPKEKTPTNPGLYSISGVSERIGFLNQQRTTPLSTQEISKIHQQGFQTIGKAPEPTLAQKTKNVFEPIISFLTEVRTGLKPRERTQWVTDPKTKEKVRVGSVVSTGEFRGLLQKDPSFSFSRDKALLYGVAAFPFRAIEAIPLAAMQMVQNYKGVAGRLKGEEGIPSMKIPFDARRLGFDKPDEKIEESGVKLWNRFDELNEEKPPNTTAQLWKNALTASFDTVVQDALNVFIAAGAINFAAKGTLAVTKYDPVFERNLSMLGIGKNEVKNLTPKTLISKAKKQFFNANTMHDKIEIIRAGREIAQKYQGEGFIQLNPFFQKIQNFARDVVLPLEKRGMGYAVRPISPAGPGLPDPKITKLYAGYDPKEAMRIAGKAATEKAKQAGTFADFSKALNKVDLSGIEKAGMTAQIFFDAVKGTGIAPLQKSIQEAYQGTGQGSVRRTTDTGIRSFELKSETIENSGGNITDKVKNILKEIQGKPDAEITIYRGAPKGAGINKGDWVALDESVAKKFTKSRFGKDIPDFEVQKLEVKASEVVPQKSAGKDRIYDFAYIPDKTTTLQKSIQEAKAKGLSGEEWVKTQPKAFHGTLIEDAKLIEREGFKSAKELEKITPFPDSELYGDVIFLTTDKKQAQRFGEAMGTERGISTFGGENVEVLETSLENINLAPKPTGELTPKQFRDAIEELKKQGFDGVIDGKTRVIWNKDKIKTKSQLLEMYKGTPAVTPEITPTPEQLLKQAEGISRPAKRSEIRKAIRPEPVKKITKTEPFLLKQRFKTLARGVREGGITTRKQINTAQKQLREYINESNLSKADKDGLTGRIIQLSKVKNVDHKLRNLVNDISDRIAKITETTDVKTIRARIYKELKLAEPKISKKGILESKYSIEATRELSKIIDGIKADELRLSQFKTQGEKIAEAKKIRQESITKIEENNARYGKVNEEGVRFSEEIPESILRENILLNMRGMKAMNSNELRDMLKEIRSVKETGKLRQNILNDKKIGELDRVKEAVKEDVLRKKDKEAIVGEARYKPNPFLDVFSAIDNSMLGYRNLVDKLTFSKDRRVLDFTIDKIHTSRKEYIRLHTKLWNDVVRAKEGIFKTTKIKELVDLTAKQYQENSIWTGKNAWGEKVTLKLSEQEAAYWLMQLRDPSIVDIFKVNMGFTDDMIKAIEKYVSPEMSDYIEFLVRDLFKDMREISNISYIRRFGVDMPNNPRYGPVIPSDFQLEKSINLLGGDQFPHHPSTLPSFIKVRRGNAGIKKIGIDTVVRRHLNQTAQFTSFDESISDLRRVFTDPDVKRAILDNHPKTTYNNLIKKIDDISRGGMATQMMIPWMDQQIARFGKAALSFPNVVPLPKQAVTFVHYVRDMSYTDLVYGSYKFSKNPVKWTKKLMESDVLFDRVTSGFDRETALMFRPKDKQFATKKLQLSLEDFLWKSFKSPARGGDMIPILPGATSRYIQVENLLKGKKGLTDKNIIDLQRKHNIHLSSSDKEALRKNGLSSKQLDNVALKNAEITTLDLQQSKVVEDTGVWQTAHSLGKATTLFKTTPIQMYRESAKIIRNMIRGKTPVKEGMRGLLALFLLSPAFFQYVSDGFEFVPRNQLRALIFGHISSFPVIGDILGAMYEAFVFGEDWKNIATSVSPLLSIPDKVQSSLSSLHRAIFNENISEERANELYIKAIKDFAEATGMAIGQPIPGYIRTGTGLKDLMTGETSDWRRLFWGNYSLEAGRKEIPSIYPQFQGTPKTTTPAFREEPVKRQTTPQRQTTPTPRRESGPAGRQSKAPDKENKLLSSIMNLLKV